MMKYLAIALVVIVCVLCPYILGKMSVSAVEERYRSACEDLGINARPFFVDVGYLSSELTLDEPLSSTLSSMGLPKEAVDFFRDFSLNVRTEVTHGPLHLLKGAEHTVLTLSGPDWELTGEEWRTNKLFGANSRTVKIYDSVMESEGVLFCSSNFWLRDEGKAMEMAAERLAIWPGLALSGLRYSSTTEDEQTSGTLCADIVRFQEGTLSGLVVKIESKPVIKGGAKKDFKCEVQKGTSPLGDLSGKTIEFETKDKFFSQLAGCLKGEANLETLISGGADE